MNKGKYTPKHDQSTSEKTSLDIQDEQTTGEQHKPKSFEDVYNAMGPPGRYQIVQISMILTMLVPLSFIYVKYAFLVIEPDFTCSRVNKTELLSDTSYISNATGPYDLSYQDSCEIKIGSNSSGKWRSIKSAACKDGYNYTGGKDTSIITEWDLVCDRQGIAELAQSVVSIGFMVGNGICVMSDRFGRKRTTVVSLILTNVVDIATAFAPDVYSFFALRFCVGIFLSGVYINAYVLPAELLPSKYREMFAMLAGTVWSVCIMFLCGVAYIFRNDGWRDFQLYSAIIGMLPLLFMYFINESAPWLHSVGNYSRCVQIVKQACKTNKVDFNKVKQTLDECFQNRKSDDVGKYSVKTYSILDLFRYKRLFVGLSITWIATFTNEITYTGLFLTASNLVGNFYLNITLLAVLSIPGCFINWILLKYKGRRFVLILFIAMTAVCLLISTLSAYLGLNSRQTNDLNLAFFLLGKFSISACYNTLFLYIPELFPTSIRSSALGLATSGSDVGGALASYLLPLSKIASWAPGTVLTCCCFLASGLFLLLPETKEKQLETTLVEDDSVIKSRDNKKV